MQAATVLYENLLSELGLPAMRKEIGQLFPGVGPIRGPMGSLPVVRRQRCEAAPPQLPRSRPFRTLHSRTRGCSRRLVGRYARVTGPLVSNITIAEAGSSGSANR